jgi:hypothetical protein
VINHLAVPRLGRGDSEDAVLLADWRAGMAALAALPFVYVKLSMLDFVRKEWRTDAAAKAQVKSIVNETIRLFGANRCMFASNFPVERASGGWAFAELFTVFQVCRVSCVGVRACVCSSAHSKSSTSHYSWKSSSNHYSNTIGLFAANSPHALKSHSTTLKSCGCGCVGVRVLCVPAYTVSMSCSSLVIF